MTLFAATPAAVPRRLASRPIEAPPFVQERNLPVVIGFETADGSPRLYGPSRYVDSIANDYDWDSVEWGYTLTLEWPTEGLTRRGTPPPASGPRRGRR